MRRRRRRTRGQSLAEFALVFPVFIALVGGIVQFGMVFWAQNTLTQVARDAGRWEATQQTCSGGSSAFGTQANSIAVNSGLFGYSSGEFSSPSVQSSAASVTSYSGANSMAVAWTHDSSESPSQGCPPTSNAAVWHVTIKMNHSVPTFFPGLQFLPGLGNCTSSGCSIQLSSSVQYRMEPAP